jgi:S-formylglutathione hydrolase FrmB
LQGGFCSTSYAARHPDLFATTISYSGAPDIAWDADVRAGSTAVINATEVGLDGVPPNSMFGDRATQEIDQAETPEAAVAGTKVFETMAAITRVRGRKRA